MQPARARIGNTAVGRKTGRLNPNDPNVLLLEAVARRLDDDLLRDFVFIGGAVAGLLITDSAAPAIRATEDVDLIVQVATLADYHRVEARGLLAR